MSDHLDEPRKSSDSLPSVTSLLSQRGHTSCIKKQLKKMQTLGIELRHFPFNVNFSILEGEDANSFQKRRISEGRNMQELMNKCSDDEFLNNLLNGKPVSFEADNWNASNDASLNEYFTDDTFFNSDDNDNTIINEEDTNEVTRQNVIVSVPDPSHAQSRSLPSTPVTHSKISTKNTDNTPTGLPNLSFKLMNIFKSPNVSSNYDKITAIDESITYNYPTNKVTHAFDLPSPNKVDRISQTSLPYNSELDNTHVTFQAIIHSKNTPASNAYATDQFASSPSNIAAHNLSNNFNSSAEFLVTKKLPIISTTTDKTAGSNLSFYTSPIVNSKSNPNHLPEVIVSNLANESSSSKVSLIDVMELTLRHQYLRHQLSILSIKPLPKHY